MRLVFASMKVDDKCSTAGNSWTDLTGKNKQEPEVGPGVAEGNDPEDLGAVQGLRNLPHL